MLDILRQLFTNDVLWLSIVTSSLAQFLKPFTYWKRTGKFSWRHLAETGGMPSSHTAMVSALAAGVGIEQGFGSATFAISVVLAVIVMYDAANVRREAGTHARIINLMIAELLEGHPINETRLREVLGHTYREVIGGVVFGIMVMLLWKFGLQPLLR